MRLGLSSGLPVQARLGAAPPPPPPPPGLLGAESGFLFDPSDFGSMSVACDGSGPAPGIGDVVGTIRDLSGGGHHAVAPSNAARPRLELRSGKPALVFDGVDDVFRISGLTLGPALSVFAGFRKAKNGMVIGAAAGSTPPADKLIRAGGVRAQTSYPFTDGSNFNVTVSFGAEPHAVSLIADASSVLLSVAAGETRVVTASAAPATLTTDLFIGDKGVSAGDALGGALYGLAAFTNAAVSAAKRAEVEFWINQRLGDAA